MKKMRKQTLAKFLLTALMFLVPSIEMNAQDWKNILTGVASSLGEKVSEKAAEKINYLSVEGTWTYVKPDCKFESDNLLAKAGSEIASNKIEEKITELMQKLGIDEQSVFTFNSDSTYTIKNSKRTTQGTYSLNKETQEITLVSRLNFHFTAKISKNVLSPNKMSLLFKADKLMSVAKTITGSLTRNSTNKTMGAINAILDGYNGMMLGFELESENQKVQPSFSKQEQKPVN